MSLEIMLDLEWMGKPPNAAIIAIGAVAICRESLSVLGSISLQVSLESSMKAGCKVDADTILWWMQQSDEARRVFMDNDSALKLSTALIHLNDFIKLHEYGSAKVYRPLTKVWGYGANADNAVIDFAYKASSINKPWGFRADKCFRTRMDDFSQDIWVDFGTAHNAHDDAMAQALTLIETYKA